VTSRIFVDTLFVVALINPRDQHHSKAAELERITFGCRGIWSAASRSQLLVQYQSGDRAAALHTLHSFVNRSNRLHLVYSDG
jgi:predicted nucleic acid-binding protein